METGSSPAPSSEMDEVLARISTLPTPARIYDQVTSMLADPKTSAKGIADVISSDQSITARLLRMVNSPFYGFAEEVATVSRAITIIGFAALRNLVLASSLMDLFASRHNARGLFNLDLLWMHSLATGMGARAIAKRIGRSGEAEEFFVAGLMHDVGKLVLLQYFPEKVDVILARVRSQRCLFVEAERQVLGTEHTAIGSAVAEQWHLPVALREAIALHHMPTQAKDAVRAGAIHLADIIARALLFGSGGDKNMPSLNEEAYSLLRLTDEKLYAVMQDVERSMATDHLAAVV